ncbi:MULTISPECIES: hypothetical protein [unclassified Actinomyces]|uniref:hypothetical protein n=1 Tax=unclassified Actinomyces TaxID=2609248 RepID=UPI001373D32A|nr:MULTISPECIES: hypothetical protein [unclassified Actinomyces]MBW3069750.1 hypothetical protein [Actinomyces sp. 594]NDR52779.1 hypothetical protein [Actinomyces sp. 565]QHO91221.1 hypothetical protein CWT12_07685 [Actinomyces sp. 432]
MTNSRSPDSAASGAAAGGKHEPPGPTPGVPWLVDAGLVLTTALVTRAGPRTAFVRVFPRQATAEVRSVGEGAGFVLEQPLPQSDWLVLTATGERTDALADARIGALADALIRSGLRAFAYTGAGPDGSTGTLPARCCRGLRRLGHERLEAEDGTVFMEVSLHDPLFGTDLGPPSAQTVVYGAGEDLALLQEGAAERFVIEPVLELGGVAALQIEHAEVAAGLTSLEELVAELDTALGDCGLQGPIHIVDRRTEPPGA